MHHCLISASHLCAWNQEIRLEYHSIVVSAMGESRIVCDSCWVGVPGLVLWVGYFGEGWTWDDGLWGAL